MKTTRTPNNIDEYIANFPGHIQLKLEEMRAAIRNAAPDAEEIIMVIDEVLKRQVQL